MGVKELDQAMEILNRSVGVSGDDDTMFGSVTEGLQILERNINEVLLLLGKVKEVFDDEGVSLFVKMKRGISCMGVERERLRSEQVEYDGRLPK